MHVLKGIPFKSLFFLGAVLALPACSTTAYIPSNGELSQSVAAPAELKAVTANVSYGKFYPAIELQTLGIRVGLGSEMKAEAESWFAGKDEGGTLEISNHPVGKKKGAWTLLIYLGSLGALPFVMEREYESVLTFTDSAGNKIFTNSDRYKARTAGALLPTAMFFGGDGNVVTLSASTDLMNRHKLAIGQHLAQMQSEYQQAVAADTVAAHRDYLRQHPDSFFRPASLQRLVELTPSRNELGFHVENLALAEDYFAYIPEEQTLWFLGPEGLRVHDLLTQSRSQSVSILAARVRAADAPYRVFSTDEINRLQRSGIKPELVVAMLEVSTTKVAAPAAQPVGAGAVATPAALTATPAAASEDPAAADIAVQCAKRLAAMQACKQIPSFGRSICKAQVQRTYDHIVCSVIQ